MQSLFLLSLLLNSLWVVRNLIILETFCCWKLALVYSLSLCGVSIHPVLSVAIETTTCRNKCIKSLSVWSVEGGEPTLRLSGDKTWARLLMRTVLTFSLDSCHLVNAFRISHFALLCYPAFNPLKYWIKSIGVDCSLAAWTPVIWVMRCGSGKTIKEAFALLQWV